MTARSHFGRIVLVAAALIGSARGAYPLETDQFTTPRTPLYDIGPLLSRKIAELIACDRTGRDPERVVYDWVGRDAFSSRAVRWINQIRVPGESVRFRPVVADSIYAHVFSPIVGSFLFNAATVNVHGFNVGTDKIDHFFQQGHDYYEQVVRAEREGAGREAGIATAVAHGVKQEHTYYGTLVSGVYSNGDLAANYAGMKFYLNLRNPVRIGDHVEPPLLEHGTTGWTLRRDLDRSRLLEPFFSNHMDESLNPSRYRFSRGELRSSIRDRCAGWMRANRDRAGLVASAGRSFAETWFGEEYGHWLPAADEVSIATECTP